MGWRNDQAERNHGVKNIGLEEPESESPSRQKSTIAELLLTFGLGLLVAGTFVVAFLILLLAASLVLRALVGSW